MNSSSNCCEKWAPCARATLRIIVGFLFLQHGTQKLFGWPMQGPPELNAILAVGGWLEFVGGIMFLLGLFTSPVAMILCGEMAYAFWFVHFKAGPHLPMVNKGELAVLYCFIFFYFIFAGAGSASLDKLIFCRKCSDESAKAPPANPQ